ncbi:MAG TPA: hypothetical protein VF541_06755 [Longimicrobium sp.]|jgi:hypothetical protein
MPGSDSSRRRAATTDDAKEAILDLIAAAGGVFHEKVRLHKAFYFAHLFFWREGEGVLTAHPIVRAPQGPFIDEAERLLQELQRDGFLKMSTAPVGPFEEAVYHLHVPRSVPRDTARGRAIYQAVDFVVNRSAAELSDLTHEHSITWQTTQDGREMDIYLDLLPSDALSRMRREIAELRTREEMAR